MEYEKKYNDSLERAKSFIKRGGEYERLVMESIFPELKESEDERIRKIIIGQMELWHECALENNAVQDIKDSADAISYLEKQKEQKTIDGEGKFESIDNAFRRGREIGFHEGVESVKSAEWSKEDIDKMVIARARKSGATKSEMEFYRQGIKDVLSSLRLQPKQERQIKEGDKVSIHCRKDRKKDMIVIYDGKVGEVIHVWDA